MKIYIVKNQEGKFLRTKGYGGSGNCWVDAFEKAKVYTKIGPAKAQCTFWYGAYPKFGCPFILEFELDPTKAAIVSMDDHVKKYTDKKKEKEARREEEQKAYFALQNETTIRDLLKTLSQEQKKKLGINA